MSGPISFGEPFVCNKDDAKCYACKNKIEMGEKLLWDFNNKHRYHESCGRERAASNVQTVELGPETIKAFAELCKVKEPAKPGLFADRMPLGMNMEQVKAFNALAERVDHLEKRVKELIGE